MTNSTKLPPQTPHFPTHNAPRVWLLTSGDSPIGISLARQVLSHGDYVVSGLIHTDLLQESPRTEELKSLLAECERRAEDGWRDRLRIVELDVRCGSLSYASFVEEQEAGRVSGVLDSILPDHIAEVCIWNNRMMGQCQAAVAAAVDAFGRLDILMCCTSQAVVGTVEELAESQRTLTLVRDQFETNFFGPMNIIKAALPQMRHQKIGHMMALTGITGHLGTPGLGMYCASGWALEGFCDSIAYEIAPFNIKMTIVQANVEIGILTNRVTTAPPLPDYSGASNPAPLFRGILDSILNRLPNVQNGHTGDGPPNLLSSPGVVSLFPPLSSAHITALIAETVHALTAIGGHENPPARHIVGVEGVAAVKEKLKTVSEELEDFVDVSGAADIDEDDEARIEEAKAGFGRQSHI